MTDTPFDYPKSLAAVLRVLMDREGYSQMQIQERGQLAQKTVSNILNQATSPSLSNLIKLAAVFDLPPWALLLPYPEPSTVLDTKFRQLIEQLLSLPAEDRAALLKTLQPSD